MLSQVLDTLIPPDPERQMPGADEVGVGIRLRAEPNASTTDAYLALVQEMLREWAEAAGVAGTTSFAEWPAEQRLDLLNGTRRRNIRLFTAFITAVFQAYFTCPAVLARIGSGAVPPFPHGNPLPADDWALLEPVFERGRIYRDVEC